MVNICPFCGAWLVYPVNDGITSCQNCNRVFDNSSQHRLLCAAWACRKNQMMDMGYIKDQYQLTEEQVDFIEKHAECSHDELLHLIAA